MAFCTKCGNQLLPAAKFCPKCGAATGVVTRAPAPPASAPVSPPAPPAWPPSAAPLPQAFAPVKKRSGLPLLLIFLGVLTLIAVAVVGGLYYAAMQVKDKVTSVAHAVTQATTDANEKKADAAAPSTPGEKDANDVGGLLGNLGSMLGGGDDQGDPVEAISEKDPVDPCGPAPYPSQTGATVPLIVGASIATAWGVLNGDVESKVSVGPMGPTSFITQSETEAHKNDDGTDEKAHSTTEEVCNEDLASANSYATVTWTHLPQILHGVTRLRLSDKSFQEIKSTGKTDIVYFDIYNVGEVGKPTHEEGVLTRVEPGDVAYPMIVNDQRVNLPTIHLTGTMEPVGKNPIPLKDRMQHEPAEMYVVDDPRDPLVLMFRLKGAKSHGGKFRIEVVKIDFPVAKPINLVEKQLAEQKHAITWGIYFDFNKDTIKPESAPVLKDIAQAMTDNPDWKLTVEGNTDNIGGDSYNLDLSKRRAAAVKQALVTQYHIAPDRLSTDGYGASHPIETNDTLEGRARNRRVELTRE